MGPALLAALGACALAAAVEIADVQVVNVTPSTFSIVFRASAPVTPNVSVYADVLGTQALAGQVGVESFPIHTGRPDMDPGYRRRASVRDLQARLQARALGYLRVSQCVPGTTYYYRVHVMDEQGRETSWPADGALPSVTTARQTVMVPQARRLLVQLEGEDVAGEIVLLTSGAAPYPLAAVVGDGAGVDEAIFNLPDFLDTEGQTNRVPLGTHEFTATLPVEGSAGSRNVFAMEFTSEFMVATTASAAYVGREFVALIIEAVFVRTGEHGALPIQLTSGTGIESVSFRLTLDRSRLTDLALQDLAPQIDTASVLGVGGDVFQISFGTKADQVFSGAQTIARLTFRASPDQSSAFLPLQLSSLTALKPGGDPMVERYGSSGRMLFLGEEALLEAIRSSDGTHALNLFGKPGSAYVLEVSGDLADPGKWIDWRTLPLEGYQATIPRPALLPGPRFYRARELTADPPRLEAGFAVDGTARLTLYGQPGTRYQLQSTTNLASIFSWQPVREDTFTNSFLEIQGLSLTGPSVFFRLVKP